MAGGGWGKLLLDRPPNQIMLEAQKYVRERLARKWLPLFVMTEAFQERQRPHIKMEDVVDDVMASKRKRYMAIYKVKYLSSCFSKVNNALFNNAFTLKTAFHMPVFAYVVSYVDMDQWASPK